MWRAAIVVVLAIAHGAAAQGVEQGIDALGSADPSAVARAVEDVERSSHDPDVLFAAGRACEDKLLDPARALAIYERILREMPDARVWAAAQRRAEALRAELGPNREHAREATELAQLVADADHLPPAEITRRATALADAEWPGAPTAALWLADWLRRTSQFAEAQARYAAVATRWPGSPQAIIALRSGAGNALDAHAWSLAEELAHRLPTQDPSDAVLRDDLLEAASRGRLRDRLYRSAWLVLGVVLAALALSLAEAALRGGRRRPSLRPPAEVLFLAPVAAVLIAVAFTAHRAIVPAVTMISVGGLVFAWLSGAALDLLRARDRPVHARAILHIAACVVGVVALGYIALMRDGLLEMLIETVRFGPDP